VHTLLSVDGFCRNGVGLCSVKFNQVLGFEAFNQATVLESRRDLRVELCV